MTTVIGVRFRSAGKIYYFDPGEEFIARGKSVIVETARGMEMGMVILPNTEVEDDKVIQPLKPVIRIADTADFDVVRENKRKEKEAFRICQEKIREHQLEMKLIDVEYTFDNNKILFYFTADGRIDFRELVKDLAYIFKTRIELRQIGVRDETKILGGFGICGRSLCCHSYLSDFVPVSIKMAKEQNLSLNPTKISGVCGRLMCCLKNEEETYEYLNSQLPRNGEMVTVTHEGVEGTVTGTSILSQKVKVLVRLDGDETEMREYPLDALDFGPNRKPPIPIAAVMLPEEDPNQVRSNTGRQRNNSQAEKKEGGKNRRNRRSGSEGEASVPEGEERENRRGQNSEHGSRRGNRSRSERRGEMPDRGEEPYQTESGESGARDRRNRSAEGTQKSRRSRSEENTSNSGRKNRSEETGQSSSRRSRRNRNHEEGENSSRRNRSHEDGENSSRRNRGHEEGENSSRRNRGHEEGENSSRRNRSHEEGKNSGTRDQRESSAADHNGGEKAEGGRSSHRSSRRRNRGNSHHAGESGEHSTSAE